MAKSLPASKQTRLKLKKGFHNAPIAYRVLSVATFSPADMKIIAKGLIIATTPERAKALLPKVAGHQFVTPLWQLRMVTFTGNHDVYALLYKGLEVAAFWKRQTSEVIPDPEDPVPEGVLENPDDVWVRFDLLYKSARQLTLAVSDDLTSLRNENIQLKAHVDALNRMSSVSLQKKIKSLEGFIETNGTTIKSLQSQVRTLEAKLKRK